MKFLSFVKNIGLVIFMTGFVSASVFSTEETSENNPEAKKPLVFYFQKSSAPVLRIAFVPENLSSAQDSLANIFLSNKAPYEKGSKDFDEALHKIVTEACERWLEKDETIEANKFYNTMIRTMLARTETFLDHLRDALIRFSLYSSYTEELLLDNFAKVFSDLPLSFPSFSFPSASEKNSYKKFPYYLKDAARSLCDAKNTLSSSDPLDKTSSDDTLKKIEELFRYCMDNTFRQLEYTFIDTLLTVPDKYYFYVSATGSKDYSPIISPLSKIRCDFPALKAVFSSQTLVLENKSPEEIGIINRVNDLKINNFNDFQQVFSNLYNSEKNPLSLKIKYNNGGEEEIQIDKDLIHPKGVKSAFFQDIAYLKLKTLDDFGISLSIKNFLEKIEKENTKGLIIDLRDNRGGHLLEAAMMADFFLKSKKVFSLHDKFFITEVWSNPSVFLEDSPIVVLINEKTNSAAGLLAGALQSHKRAEVIGIKSGGKATLTVPKDIKDLGILKLSTGLVYLPSGECIEGRGLTPNNTVVNPEGVRLPKIKQGQRYNDLAFMDPRDLQLKTALDFLQNDQGQSLIN